MAFRYNPLTSQLDLVNSGATTPDATTTIKGKLKLAGDLGGTADLPLIKRTSKFIVAPYGYTGPADYICASSTGNQVEINQAIVAANASSTSSIVELLGGTFILTGIVVPLNNVWLRGQGMFATKLQVTSTANCHILDNRSTYTPTNPWTGGQVSDMELDGSTMNPAVSKKGFDSAAAYKSKIFRIYAHDTTATGIGTDDYIASTCCDNFVVNCGYVNKHTITAASWTSDTFTFTTSTAHGYSAGTSIIVVSGMTPVYYNGRFVVSSIVSSTVFTVNLTNNSGSNNLHYDPGTATTFGVTSDSIIGHNGIGIASGAATTEATIVTDNICIGNQNNNFLIEADQDLMGPNAGYIFSNNISVNAGQVGYRNTGTINAQFNNNFDYGSLIGFEAISTSQTRTITAASWTGGVATFTTSVAHGYSALITPAGFPAKAEISGMTPSGYNGYYTVTSIPTSTTFTVNITNNPGAATVFGTSVYIFHNVYGSSFNDCVAAYNLDWGIRLPSHSDGVMVKDTTIKYGYNFGLQANSTYSQFSGLRINNCGRQGLFLATPTNNIVPLAHVDISDCLIWNNGTRRILTKTNGIDIDAATGAPIEYITLNNIQAWDDQDTQTQTYGVIIQSGGTMNNVQITGGDLSGNATGALIISNTSNTIYASNIGGVNPIGKYDIGNTTGSTTFNSSLGSYFTATLTGNITAVMPASAVEGTSMTWVLTQDGTGSRTLTLPANAVAAQGGLTLSTPAASVDTITWAYDTTTSKWRETNRALATQGSLLIANNLSDVANVGTSRTNLGLGTTSTPTFAGMTLSETTAGANITVTGANSTIPLIVTIDSSIATQSALSIKNNTNFAHSGYLTQVQMLNATDSGIPLRLENSGTGKNISSTDGSVETFSITKAGVISATSLTGLTTPLSVSQGGSGVTSSTGTGSVVLGTSPSLTTPSVNQLNDSGGNPWLVATPTASAVSYVGITNAVSGGTITLAATASSGTPNFVIKGSGTFALRPTTNGTNAIRLQDSAGSNNILSADTTNIRVAIGGTTPTATLDVRGNTTIAGNLTLNTAGNKISITTGTNASAGTGTLTSGTVTISTTAVTASSLIFLTDTASSLTNVGVLSVTSKSAGTSFTVTSTNVLDTGTFNWLIIN
jgi:hypothetical protein